MTNSIKFNNTLIIGGTGMLAEASAYVAGISKHTTIGARNPEQLAKNINATPLVINWNNRKETQQALANVSPCDLVISWIHADGIWLVLELEKLLIKGGRSIRVLGSSSENNHTEKQLDQSTRSNIWRQTVTLGWVNAANGRRWLTHEEISSGVIGAINSSRQASFWVGDFAF